MKVNESELESTKAYARTFGAAAASPFAARLTVVTVGSTASTVGDEAELSACASAFAGGSSKC